MKQLIYKLNNNSVTSFNYYVEKYVVKLVLNYFVQINLKFSIAILLSTFLVEIGYDYYFKKWFNYIGALTSKQYSFISRSWELIGLNSNDYSDGFGLNIRILLKNNQIVKILPRFNFNNNDDNWISNKTRFSFDGMFSLERSLYSFNIYENKTNDYWQYIFNNISQILYFQDHLARHSYSIFKFGIVINNFLDIESIKLLLLLKKQYSFIEIKKLEKTLKTQNDIEQLFLTNSIIKQNTYFEESNLCLLLGINPRFEGYFLNLKLRSAVKNNNLKVNSLNSKINTTYPIKNIGSNLITFNEMLEGNQFFCQNLKEAINPIFFFSSEFLKRNDTFLNNINIISVLQTYLPNFYNEYWNGFNSVNTTISDTGFQSLTKTNHFIISDLNTFNVLHFLNVKFSSVNLNFIKFLELKLLYKFNFSIFSILEQNFMLKKKITNTGFKLIQNTLQILNKNFFETTGKFIDTTGTFINSTNIISSGKNKIIAKTDSSILEDFYYSFKNIQYISDLTINNPLKYYSIIHHLVDFLYLPSNYISLSNSFYYRTTICSVYFNLLLNKIRPQKFYRTKIYGWLEDFYTNGKDLYSSFSVTMLQCSISHRKKVNNFLF